MKMNFFNWTAESVDNLRNIWMNGDSAAQIASVFGVSRNSIMGKITRLDMPPRQTINAVVSRDKLVKPRKRKPAPRPAETQTRIVRSHTGYAVMETSVPRELVDIPDEDIPVEQRRTFLELERHHCRWPIGGKKTPAVFFCGATTFANCSYCYAHFCRSTAAPGKPRVPYIAARRENV